MSPGKGGTDQELGTWSLGSYCLEKPAALRARPDSFTWHGHLLGEQALRVPGSKARLGFGVVAVYVHLSVT